MSSTSDASPFVQLFSSVFSQLRSSKDLTCSQGRKKLIIEWVNNMRLSIYWPECSLEAGHYAKIIWFIPCNNSEEGTLLSLLCRLRNWNLEGLHDLLKVTGLVNGRKWIEIQTVGAQYLSMLLHTYDSRVKESDRGGVNAIAHSCRAIALFPGGAILGLDS